MNSLPLFDAVAPSLPRKRGQVPKTSVLAYRATDADGRVQRVLGWLFYMRNMAAPTSKEIARFAHQLIGPYDQPIPMELTLYVRRGLSDAKAKGLVQQGEKRICRVAGTLAVTWKVATR